MKSVLLLRFLAVLAIALFAGVAPLHAQDMGALKARMEQRQPAVDGLKDRGAAGENNRGYLEARGSLGGEDQKIISDENSDRRTVYAAIAAETGTNADVVGKARAAKIAATSRRGVWLQAVDGNWYQKN